MSFYLSALNGSLRKSTLSLIEYTSNRFFPSEEKISQFFEAFAEGNFVKVDELVAEGLNPNVVDSEGNNVFHKLASRLEGFGRVIKTQEGNDTIPMGPGLRTSAEKAEALGINKLAVNAGGQTPNQIARAHFGNKGALITVLNR